MTLRPGVVTAVQAIPIGKDERAMKPARDDERLSPEERAELHRELEQMFFGRRRPRRPMLVCDRGRVVGDAKVNVSPFDPNWRAGEEIRLGRFNGGKK